MILTSSFDFCTILHESLTIDFNLPEKQYLVTILQNTNAWYQNHTILCISFGSDVISINTLCVGRPLLRPFQVADAEATLQRQYTLCNIWKCWHHSTVTVYKWSVMWIEWINIWVPLLERKTDQMLNPQKTAHTLCLLNELWVIFMSILEKFDYVRKYKFVVV